jgi:CubicO group peptidase (beta-lactamase class C family)
MKASYTRLFIMLLLLIFSSCQVGRYIWYNFADITDYKIFPSRPLNAVDKPFVFSYSKKPIFPKFMTNDKDTLPFEQYLAKNKTVAFLIIKGDSIHYENYFNKYNQESMVASFSMAKSVTSILIGCAIDDGLISSVEDPITKYIPELSKNGFDKVSIKHILQMTSGLQFNESYFNLFGHAASFYYGKNIRKRISKLKLKQEPGKSFEYVSGNTQLLGLLLEKVLKGKTITQYLQEKIWTPLAMEYDASWSIDQKNNGLEKTFCCLNARARDFAKIGRLYKRNGEWNGLQVVSKNWVQASIHPEVKEGSVNYYQYQWWIPSRDGDFLAEGILGQFIYINPKKDLVMVRLGKDNGRVNWGSVFRMIANKF